MDGKPVGTLVAELVQYIDLNPLSGNWAEDDTVISAVPAALRRRELLGVRRALARIGSNLAHGRRATPALVLRAMRATMPGGIGDSAVPGWGWIDETGLELGGSFTFARGASPERVIDAFGMNPANAFFAADSEAAQSLPYHGYRETHPPEHPWIRVGTAGEWGFALDESSGGFGWYEEDAAIALSAGAEAVLLTHTPTIDTFHYYVNGTQVTGFEPLRAWDRWGTDPDRFLAQMQQAGLRVDPPPPGSYTPFRNPVIATLEMLTLALGIRLDRGIALGPLLTVQRD
jgi:Family of unknown function (DUF6461)